MPKVRDKGPEVAYMCIRDAVLEDIGAGDGKAKDSKARRWRNPRMPWRWLGSEMTR
jgi:hypothetical protein